MENSKPVKTLREFWPELATWSQATFGTDQQRGPIGPLKHLKKEVDECLREPSDLVEYADLQFLIFDAARRAGYSHDQLVKACFEKLAVNKARKWQKPSSDEPIEGVNEA